MLTQDMNPGLLRLLLERRERELAEAVDALRAMEHRFAELVRRLDVEKERVEAMERRYADLASA